MTHRRLLLDVYNHLGPLIGDIRRRLENALLDECAELERKSDLSLLESEDLEILRQFRAEVELLRVSLKRLDASFE